MRNLWVICLGAFMLLGSALAQESDTPSFEIDPVATAQVPWQVGEKTIEEAVCHPYKSDADLCYTVFLGVTEGGDVIVQDFYATGEKQSDPYRVISLDGAKASMEDRMRYSPSVDGEQVFYFKDGQKEAEASYQKGKRQGLWVWWHSNGQMALEKNYQDDELHGAWRQWYENGQQEMEAHYQKGHSAGVWRQWAVDGSLIDEHDFGNMP